MERNILSSWVGFSRVSQQQLESMQSPYGEFFKDMCDIVSGVLESPL